GHAIIHHVLPNCDPVHEVSIIQRGRAGGYTLSLPTDDKNYVSKNDMLDNLVSLLGGRVAEKLVLDDISTGASNDIERASKIARDMVTKYGMSEKIGPISFRSENDEVFLGMSYSSSREYSEKFASDIDVEVKSIIDNAYTRCIDILNENMSKLHDVANALIEKEKISGEEFVEIFEGKKIEETIIEENAEE
ncbi:MAG: cell division protein FtsH, partial [Clostridia bacterium]|nr:cell division protein FtsH [Clostridia bacterium]